MAGGASPQRISQKKISNIRRKIESMEPTVSAREAIEELRPVIEAKRKVVPLVDIIKEVADDLGIAVTTAEYYMMGRHKKGDHAPDED